MWGELVIDSVRRPRLAARRILDAGLPDATVIEAAVLVTCAGIVLGYLALRATPDGIDMVSRAILANPLLGAAAQLAAMAVVVFLTVRIGRLFGGRGELWGAAALVVWLNAMLVLVQAGQLVALALLPPVAAILAVAATIWALGAYANFIAELHGFQNPVIVLGAVVLTGLMLFFATAMLLAILGLTPREVG
jgi:hypothetical protein